VRAGRIPDVAGLEQQDRAQIGGVELLLDTLQAVLPEAIEVDAILPVHAVEPG
jgi:hypothetical protein